MDVDVHKHPKQPRQDLFGRRKKGFRKRNIYSKKGISTAKREIYSPKGVFTSKKVYPAKMYISTAKLYTHRVYELSEIILHLQ